MREDNDNDLDESEPDNRDSQNLTDLNTQNSTSPRNNNFSIIYYFGKN